MTRGHLRAGITTVQMIYYGKVLDDGAGLYAKSEKERQGLHVSHRHVSKRDMRRLYI